GTPPRDGAAVLPAPAAPMPWSGSPATLVGRDAELAMLCSMFREAAAGEGQAVFIQGEPGIGKTSVVEAFLDELRASSDTVLVGYGLCVEQHGEREPYMPALEALERLGQGPGRDRLLPLLRAVAPSWLAQMPSLDASPQEHPRRADSTPPRMLREFAHLVEALAADQPPVPAPA